VRTRTYLVPDGLSGVAHLDGVGGQGRVGPEVVTGARHHQRGLLVVGGAKDAVGLPGVDLAVGEHNARRLDVGASVQRLGVLDVAHHLGGGLAECLVADIQIHLNPVKTL
jgi:hypothetical protein